MYLLMVDSKNHTHKQRYCDKVIDHRDHLVIWEDGKWEVVDSSGYTSYHTGSDKHLIRKIESWEWEKWHTWDECSGS
jgi:hypothetical protein